MTTIGTSLITAVLASLSVSAHAQTPVVKNVVLVHGAFADGSGWRGVYNELTRRGYRVTIVQNPLTSLADDVAATTRVLDRQDGPTVLVGHSWGGTVITEAGVHGRLFCELCLEGRVSRYPVALAERAFEVHHLAPLAEASLPVRTTLGDVAVLCANCHRSVHSTADVDVNVRLLAKHFSGS